MPPRKATKATRRMPVFTKAPQALLDEFSAAIAQLPDVQTRTMFSYPAAFIKGHMFAYVFRDDMIVRLPESDHAALRAEGWKPFEPMPGRKSTKYLAVPAAVRREPKSLARWLTKARGFAAALPAKKKR